MIVSVDETNVAEAGRIHSLSWQASHRQFCTEEFVARHTAERQRDYLKKKMEEGSAVFMLFAPDPVGIVSVRGDLIEDLYVLPEFQGRGFGTELLRYAIGRCRGVPTLWILENNERAAALYRRHGFTETHRREHITDGLDEIEFSLGGPEYGKGE